MVEVKIVRVSDVCGSSCWEIMRGSERIGSILAEADQSGYNVACEWRPFSHTESERAFAASDHRDSNMRALNAAKRWALAQAAEYNGVRVRDCNGERQPYVCFDDGASFYRVNRGVWRTWRGMTLAAAHIPAPDRVAKAMAY